MAFSFPVVSSIGLFPLLYSYRGASHTKLGSSLAWGEHILFDHPIKNLFPYKLAFIVLGVRNLLSDRGNLLVSTYSKILSISTSG